MVNPTPLRSSYLSERKILQVYSCGFSLMSVSQWRSTIDVRSIQFHRNATTCPFVVWTRPSLPPHLMDIRRSLAQPRQSVFSAGGSVVPLNEGPASHLSYLQATVQMTARCSATVSSSTSRPRAVPLTAYLRRFIYALIYTSNALKIAGGDS